MSADRLQTARRLVDAVDRRDRDGAFACMAPAIEWRATGQLGDQRLDFHGRDEVWGYLGSLDESLADLRASLDSIEEVGELVVARVRLHGTGRAGGAPAELAFSSVARFEDGRIARVDNYVDHDEALTDAALKAAR